MSGIEPMTVGQMVRLVDHGFTLEEAAIIERVTLELGDVLHEDDLLDVIRANIAAHREQAA